MSRILSILLFCCVFVSACAQKSKSNFPVPLGYISDFENLFTGQERKILDSMLTAYEKETAVEIAVVTLHDKYPGIANFDSLVTALHNEWGVGKKDKNNGVLLAICLPLRKTRISTGRGIERMLTNDEARKIIEEILVPEFRNAKYFEGTRRVLVAIMNELR
jgi:uncharacterized protein